MKEQDDLDINTTTNIPLSLSSSSSSMDQNHSLFFGAPLPPWLDPQAYGEHADFFPYDGDLRQLSLPWVREPNFVPLVVAHLLTLVLGLFGNGLVMSVLCCGGRPGRCVTFPCLLSVAVADVLFLSVCVPHEVLRHFLTDWRLSACLCKLSAFAEMVSAMAAVLNLVLISLERYFVIAHPLMSKSLCTSRKAQIALALTWIASVVLSTPAFVVMDTEVNVYYNNVTHTTVTLCGDYGLDTAGRKAWAVWRLVLLLLLPSLLLLFCYVRVILILWTSTRHLHVMTASGRVRNTTTTNKITNSSNSGGDSSSSRRGNSRNGSQGDSVFSSSSSSRGWKKKEPRRGSDASPQAGDSDAGGDHRGVPAVLGPSSRGRGGQAASAARLHGRRLPRVGDPVLSALRPVRGQPGHLRPHVQEPPALHRCVPLHPLPPTLLLLLLLLRQLVLVSVLQ